MENITEQLLRTILETLERLESPPSFFTIKGAADYIRCGHKLIRSHLSSGQLTASNIGSPDGPDYRISRKDLDEWMERRKALHQQASSPIVSRYYGMVKTPGRKKRVGTQ